jgi:hypothetical protein
MTGCNACIDCEGIEYPIKHDTVSPKGEKGRIPAKFSVGLFQLHSDWRGPEYFAVD